MILSNRYKIKIIDEFFGRVILSEGLDVCGIISYAGTDHDIIVDHQYNDDDQTEDEGDILQQSPILGSHIQNAVPSHPLVVGHLNFIIGDILDYRQNSVLIRLPI